MSDNPEPNSRLKQTLVPEQGCRPIVLSGTSIVCLEETHGFDAINVDQKVVQKGGLVPLTQEQQDLGMSRDLTGKIPALEGEGAAGRVSLLKAPQSFRNYSVKVGLFYCTFFVC
jgi:hypothetical protein